MHSKALLMYSRSFLTSNSVHPQAAIVDEIDTLEKDWPRAMDRLDPTFQPEKATVPKGRLSGHLMDHLLSQVSDGIIFRSHEAALPAMVQGRHSQTSASYGTCSD
jgi:hypothetical protein